ncbi:MAG: hypothetical protein COU85_00390 [Candidatus Portnoybacteria bacterium CG10_big_fil_rev_8_21_14_0_10_44_7]|uniref:Glycosyl transferase family 1 domain-containing protein n=1 Tax=Candidatus Portnoybacteria bacterium CG10_big_fil_rev_8_21_14_0_10_44_7 TaxID=1974816 RepID=A0A2M8KJG9_9BACT|nr:MAG: hypothetical protein COU85_00390 [Candidatus Portnoybacteria bacterium CG10_big_fil_rev_8_21_14_0_10_44_7]
MGIIKKIKRGWWLYKSAGLTFAEILNLAVNKGVYFFTWLFYSCRSFLEQGKWDLISGYARYIPASIPKQRRKRALLAYLPEAFYKERYIGRIKYYFSNNGCPLAIARALNELGYIVDVIGNDDASFMPRHVYDVAIIHNVNLIPVYRNILPARTPVVYFEVVAYWRRVLEKMRRRFDEFNRNHDSKAVSEDFAGYQKIESNGAVYDKNIASADAIIVLGDQLTRSFSGFKNVFLTTSACLPDKTFKKDLSERNLLAGKKNFVFFGGSSHNIRKGLHLLFEAFTNTPYHLYVCSSVNDFLLKAYNIEKQPNIHLVGYQKQGSKKFYNLISSCDFVIHTSGAEGIPGGVLDTMKYGLIPVVSRECNIINAAKIGRQLETCSVEEIKQNLDFVSGRPAKWLIEHAQMSIVETETTYSSESFRGDFKKAVAKIVPE